MVQKVMVDLYLTVDVDWAPDWAISELSDYLFEKQIPSTWFLTHRSPAVDKLRAYPELFELGIHPNFLPGSTHGNNPKDVLAHCMGLAPNATSMRSHALASSTHIFQAVRKHTPIDLDVSIYMRGKSCTRSDITTLPLSDGNELTRVPYSWEDDLEFFAPNPMWDAPTFFQQHMHDDFLIVDVHPIHFSLNSSTIDRYHELKTVNANLINIRREEAVSYMSANHVGTQNFLQSLVTLGLHEDLSFSRLQNIRKWSNTTSQH